MFDVRDRIPSKPVHLPTRKILPTAEAAIEAVCMKGDTFQFSLAWKDTLPQPSPFRLRFAECPTEQSIWSAAGNSPDEHSNARRFCTRPNVKGDDDAKDVDAILGKLVVCGLCPCPSHVGSSSSRSSHHGVRERRVLLAVHEESRRVPRILFTTTKLVTLNVTWRLLDKP